MSKDLSHRFFNETAGIEEIIFLAALYGEIERCPDGAESFFEDVTVEDTKRLFGIDVTEGTLPSDQDVAEYLQQLLHAGKFGFLLRFSTPCRVYHKVGYSYSWGTFYTQWVYGETFEEAVEAGFAWVAERRAAERKKYEEGNQDEG